MKWFFRLVIMLTWSGLAWPTHAIAPYTLIQMDDGSPYFTPAKATAASGTPIRWDNPTPTHHTVTHNGCIEEGAPCLFDSGTIAPGEQFDLPGLPPGRYNYHCRIHPIMRGVLIVTDATGVPSQL